MTPYQFRPTFPPHTYVPFAHVAQAYRASQEGVARYGGLGATRVATQTTAAVNAHHAAQPGEAVDPALTPAYEALWLKPGAPLPVVKAAYRSLAARTHPDSGGDPNAMLRINSAYETLRRTLE